MNPGVTVARTMGFAAGLWIVIEELPGSVRLLRSDSEQAAHLIAHEWEQRRYERFPGELRKTTAKEAK